jgi:hypothetical protein
VPREVPVGRRIALYGPSGSGKTTLSASLAEKLGLPLVQLDAVFHAHPNWVDLSVEEFRAQVSAFLAEHPQEWLIEGNYSFVRDLILPRADTAIWLDLPFTTVYRRLAWRTIWRSVTHGELYNGNKETMRQTFLSGDSMLIWGIKSWKAHRASMIDSLYTNPPNAKVYRLRTPGQVEYLLANVAPAAGAAAESAAG